MRVDHLVWYAPDLAAGERHFAERMDCRPAYGGVHPGDATRNSLISLGEQTYVEILAPDPSQDQARLDAELRGLGSAGLYHWAAGGADLETLRTKALVAGLDGSDLVTGGRTLPDGAWLGWKLFGIGNHGFGALVPFFIDWMGSPHPALSAPRGGKLVSVIAATPQPEELSTLYAVLGLDIAVKEAATPSLSAIVESATGRYGLDMIDPPPRGFVI